MARRFGVRASFWGALAQLMHACRGVFSDTCKGKQSMKVSSLVAMSAFVLVVGSGHAWAAGSEAQAGLPEGAVVAWVNIPRVAAESASGLALSERVQALIDENNTEVNTMNATLQASQERLQQGSTVMSQAASRNSNARLRGCRSMSNVLLRMRRGRYRPCRRNCSLASRMI